MAAVASPAAAGTAFPTLRRTLTLCSEPPPHRGGRPVLAGHSRGGMAIAAWSDRYRHKVEARAAAVALINTTTGDLLREVRLLPVPAPFAAVRILGGRPLINIFGSYPVPPVRRASREM